MDHGVVSWAISASDADNDTGRVALNSGAATLCLVLGHSLPGSEQLHFQVQDSAFDMHALSLTARSFFLQSFLKSHMVQAPLAPTSKQGQASLRGTLVATGRQRLREKNGASNL